MFVYEATLLGNRSGKVGMICGDENELYAAIDNVYGTDHISYKVQDEVEYYDTLEGHIIYTNATGKMYASHKSVLMYAYDCGDIEDAYDMVSKLIRIKYRNF
jgi:ribosomal protein S5